MRGNGASSDPYQMSHQWGREALEMLTEEERRRLLWLAERAGIPVSALLAAALRRVLARFRPDQA